MTMTTAVRTCLSKYADFTGRARRSEYWWFYLATFLAGLVVIVVGLILVVVASAVSDSAGSVVTVLFAIVYVVVSLGLVVPTLAVGARRLHDTDRSAWWLLIGLVPFGGIVLLVFWILDGTPGPNRFGPSPKGLAPYGGPTSGFDQGYGYPAQA